MASTVKTDYVPWHVYERDIQRLSGDIAQLVMKIDGLVEGINTLALSQRHDEIAREADAQSSRDKRSLAVAVTVAVLSAMLSFGTAMLMLLVSPL